MVTKSHHRIWNLFMHKGCENGGNRGLSVKIAANDYQDLASMSNNKMRLKCNQLITVLLICLKWILAKLIVNSWLVIIKNCTLLITYQDYIIHVHRTTHCKPFHSIWKLWTQRHWLWHQKIVSLLSNITLGFWQKVDVMWHDFKITMVTLPYTNHKWVDSYWFL